MSKKPALRTATLLLVAGGLASGLFACGSDDRSNTKPAVTDDQKPAVKDQTSPGSGQQGNGADGSGVKPDRNAPESAGDERGKAPDDVISERPGGPAGGKPDSR